MTVYVQYADGRILEREAEVVIINVPEPTGADERVGCYYEPDRCPWCTDRFLDAPLFAVLFPEEAP